MSRKPEQLVWDALRHKAVGVVLFQRHEDRYSSGIPDLSGVLRGQQFWCELKAASGSGKLLLRQRQLNWMAERASFGAPCILLARRRPDEWAGCAVSRSNLSVLSGGMSFDELADIGHSGDCPISAIGTLMDQIARGSGSC